MNTTLSIEEALVRLKMDPLKNLALINLLEIHSNSVSSIEGEGDTLVARNRKDGRWVHVASPDCDALKESISLLRDDDLRFACLEAWAVPIVTRDFEIAWLTKTYRYILPREVKLPLPARKITRLRTEDARLVSDMWEYKNRGALDYIRSQIASDLSAGIVEDGKLIAWAMMHDVGCMGVLYVLEEYRRQGLARDVTSYLATRLRALGRLPHGYVVVDNLASQSLLEGLGFVRSGEYAWLKLMGRQRQWV